VTSSSSSEVNGDGPRANGNLEAAADVAELNVATPSASIPCKHKILENANQKVLLSKQVCKLTLSKHE